MSPEPDEVRETLGRAGRRVVYHLLQATIEGLKAVEAVIEEVGNLSDHDEAKSQVQPTRIDIE